MRRSKLLRILGVPILSFATMFNSYAATSFNPYQESEKVKTKQVASGVLDFLLGSQKISGKMNSDQKLALNILNNFLKTQNQRKHELDVATAGKSQITINTTDGRQAQFVKDASGKIYLLMDGVIHPIAQEFINQARDFSIGSFSNIEGATLPSYDLRNLEGIFNSNPKEDASQNYRVQKGGEYLSDIAKKFDVSPENIFYWASTQLWAWEKDEYETRPISEKKKEWQNKKKIKDETLRIVKEKYKNEISAIFSYKWHRDLNNDGALGFNEFNQIKRTFYDNEDFNIAIQSQTEKGFKGRLELKILKDDTGELVMDEKAWITFNGPRADWKFISTGTLPVGVYIIHANMINEYSDSISSKTEKFEIIKK